MTINPRLLLTFTICVVLIGQSNGEIHRAKSPHIKSNSRNTRTTSADSNVAQHFEETSDIMEDERARYEVWIYSICGSIAVGLSGIFPLLIIPIEAGPALKHGGKFCFIHSLILHRHIKLQTDANYKNTGDLYREHTR